MKLDKCDKDYPEFFRDVACGDRVGHGLFKFSRSP